MCNKHTYLLVHSRLPAVPHVGPAVLSSYPPFQRPAHHRAVHNLQNEKAQYVICKRFNFVVAAEACRIALCGGGGGGGTPCADESWPSVNKECTIYSNWASKHTICIQ